MIAMFKIDSNFFACQASPFPAFQPTQKTGRYALPGFGFSSFDKD
jgi:hypothetical protein